MMQPQLGDGQSQHKLLAPARAPQEAVVGSLAGGWVGRANSSSWRGAHLALGHSIQSV